MADREEHAIASAGSPQADNGCQTTATSLKDTLNARGSRDATQDDTTTVDELEEALLASLEVLRDGIDQGTSILSDDLLWKNNTADKIQDSTANTNTMGESNQALLAARLNNQYPSRVVSTPAADALDPKECSRLTRYTSFDGTSEEDIDQNTSGPVTTPEVDNTEQSDSEPLSKLSGDAHSIGTNLESIYQTTSSPEIKQIIACLVHLDTSITTQTHLNNLHEAHTAKNFREQRHINKDRKLRLLETIQNVNRKFARFDADRMETENLAKQCEIRVNSHEVQLKEVKDRVKMCADGGEWMEAELTKTNALFEESQQENKELKNQNKYLKSKVRGLEGEVAVLKDRDGAWERRMTALEEYVKSKKEAD